MSKIVINSNIKSNSTNEILNNKKAIMKDDKISYQDAGINTSINVKKEEITLIRENDEMKITLKFKKNKKINSFYEIKDLKLKIEVMVDTKTLSITNNSIKINYDLYMNGEFSDNFNYDLEWRDL